MAKERPTLTETDEGKTVVDAAGNDIGVVTDVTAEGIYVKPDPSLVDRIKTTLKWEGYDEDAYRIDTDRIERTTGTDVELRAEDEPRTKDEPETEEELESEGEPT